MDSAPQPPDPNVVKQFSKVNLIYFTNESMLTRYSGLWHAGNPWPLLKMSQYLLFLYHIFITKHYIPILKHIPFIQSLSGYTMAAVVHSFSCAKIYVFIRNVYKDNMNSLINLLQHLLHAVRNEKIADTKVIKRHKSKRIHYTTINRKRDKNANKGLQNNTQKTND